MKFYKILKLDNTSTGTYWKYPKPGKWTPKRKTIMCYSGYHVVTRKYINIWLRHSKYWDAKRQVWEVEVKGKGISHKDSFHGKKYCFPQIRLVRKIGEFVRHSSSITKMNRILNKRTKKVK